MLATCSVSPMPLTGGRVRRAKRALAKQRGNFGERGMDGNVTLTYIIIIKENEDE